MRKYGIIIIVATVLVLIFGCFKTYTALTHPLKYCDIINNVSKSVDIDNSLLASVINVESSYKPNAVSSKQAIGLVQIKESTANYVSELYGLEKIEKNQLFNPEINIKYGALYLKYLIEKFCDTNTALSAYNAGETKVKSWLLDGTYSLDGKTLSYIPYEETRNYVEKINKNIKFYKKYYKN